MGVGVAEQLDKGRAITGDAAEELDLGLGVEAEQSNNVGQDDRNGLVIH